MIKYTSWDMAQSGLDGDAMVENHVWDLQVLSSASSATILGTFGDFSNTHSVHGAYVLVLSNIKTIGNQYNMCGCWVALSASD